MSSQNVAQLESDYNSLIQNYRAVSAIRPEVLFRNFLPTGYRYTTLTSVGPEFFETAIFAKVHLGMIITLYDDLADHPKHRNPELLSELYLLNIDKDHSTPHYFRGQERRVFELARFLFHQLTELLSSFPHFEMLKSALRFDIEQFYSCNRYSELISASPCLSNVMESKSLGPHNMGMVAAGTIDLMASSHIVPQEIGTCREVLLLGQRMGRISNLIFTFKREKEEGDITNEIVVASKHERLFDYRADLVREFSEKQIQIRSYPLMTFKTYNYATGLLDLHNLHSSLEGKI